MTVTRDVVTHTSAGRSATATMMMIAMTSGLMAQAGCATSTPTNQGEGAHCAPHAHGAAGDSERSALRAPEVIVTEHEHLHHRLDAAVASGGQTSERAREVAAVLHSHFQQEEAYAMPPLGLLKPLAWDEHLDDATADKAIHMAERLREEYANMLGEHEALTAALHRLAAAAKEENKPDHAAFADALIVHAQQEEQLLYPATLLIGEYLKLKRQMHEATPHGH